MADANGSSSPAHPNLNLTAEEKRVFKQLFQAADTENIGVVTGEVAVKFFERTGLEPRVLGEIWQIADIENRGLLTPAGFGIVLRLIGHYQAGRDPKPELAYKPGPLPRFDGLTAPVASSQVVSPAAATLQAQSSGGPIRVPPLTAEKVLEYNSHFDRSGAVNGMLPGEQAKQIFERAKLPNDVLGRIWTLADTEQRGALNSTDFVIAMHLLTSYKSGALRQLPTILPPGLYEAASRRPPPQSRQMTGGPVPGRPGEVPPVPGIPKQFSGSGQQRTGSPMTRPGGYGGPSQASQPAGAEWAITPAEKAQFDGLFNNVDKMNRGYITGEEAVPFFGNSQLPEETLAQIWDLADINSEGHLNRDEFAVAIHLIRKQRTERGTLPATLPPNLIPPSMRQQVRPPAQPTAPTFDNAAYATTKSASDDLFGLDSFTSASPSAAVGPSSTMAKGADSDVFASQKAPASPAAKGFPQSSPQSTFKPFVPSSSFGQNMITSSTGTSGNSGPASQSRGLYGQQPSAMEDLLGDNDPEVSRKLTSDTTDLANLSNQVGTLNKQMQDVKTKRASTEQDLSQVNSQKRDFELRLSQLQSHYEQEVKDVKTLEARLSESRSEMQKVQQDCTGLEATLQDLQTQHRQVVGALESDQRENTNLKDRIKSINADIAQLRPQLEKLRSDARQQKGMVSINKKQLSTTEGDRDRIRNEMTDLSKDQGNSRSLDQSATVQSPGGIISPAQSTASGTNPFFRKHTAADSESSAMSPAPFSQPVPGLGQAEPNYDEMFGPSYGSEQASRAPPTSFRSESQSQLPTPGLPSNQSVRSSDGPDVPTPVSSPPASSYHESPRASEPPPPPESRQITSSFLPLRSEVSRNDSFSSSVKVAPPASSSTTDTEREASKSHDTTKAEHSFGSPSTMDRNMTSSPTTADGQRSIPHTLEQRDSYTTYGAPSQSRDAIPGAFPGDTNSPIQTHPTGESSLSDRSRASSRPSEGFQSNRGEGYPNSRGDPFAANREQARGPSGTKEDFDAAFAGFAGSKTGQERQNTGGSSADGSVASGSAGPGRFNQEFPPIKEFVNDVDSDSGSDHEPGFADNFIDSSSPHRRHGSTNQAQTHYKSASRPGTGQSESTDAFGQRPPFSTASTASQLPTPGAQKSPPTYDQTVVSPESQGGSRDPNQFPPTFGGLLPSRQDPTASSHAGTNDEKAFGAGLGSQNIFGGSNASKGPSSSAPTAFSTSPPLSNTPLSTAPSDAYQSAVSHPSAGKGPSPSTALSGHSGGTKSNAFDDDFDREFGDLSEAKEADEKGEDDFGMASHHREGIDEFNPVFDSPQVSKSSTVASQHTATGSQSHAEDAFNDFEHNIGGPTHTTQPKVMPQVAAASHDWDAIFSGAGSDTTQASASTAAAPALGKGVNAPASLSTGSGLGAAPAAKAPLLRTLTSGTDDDPTLKQLTGMGYPREASIDALERYDYNVDNAADFLVRNSKDI